MDLNLEKNKDEYQLHIIKDNGKKEKFDYIKFINMLYEGNKVENVKYGQDITKEEQDQIKIMIDKISEVVDKEKAEN